MLKVRIVSRRVSARVWAVLLLSIPLSAIDTRAQGIVEGRVTDAVTREPLAGANIVILNYQVGASTDSEGKFQIALSAGPYVMSVSYLGYRTKNIDVTVGTSDTIRLHVLLVPSAVLLDQVTVVAEPTPVSSIHGLGALSISTKELQHITGAFGDIGRIVQAMAGVTSNNEMSSQFNVRGGTAHENLILLNGAQVLEPFHLKEAPNTSLSTFNASLLRNVLFFAGGFPARYGDRLSAVLDLEYRQGNKDRLSGQVEASLTDGTVILEGPLASLSSDSVPAVGLLSFRSTYSDYVAKYILDGNQRRPSFYDIQGNLGFNVSRNHNFGLHILHAADKTSGLTNGTYGSTLISLQGHHTLSRQSKLTTVVSSYEQFEDLYRERSPSITSTMNWTKDNATIRVRELKLDWLTEMGDQYSLRLGVNGERFSYQVSREASSTSREHHSLSSGNLDRSSYKAGLYTENLLQIHPRILVNLGLRTDYAALTRETKLSPRLIAAYRADSSTTFEAAWGVYYQTPTHQQLFASSSRGLPPQQMQRAIHYLVGMERVLREDLTFRVQAYYKTLDNLISFERLRSGELVHSARNDTRGTMRGIDFEASFMDDRVMGWLNFSLMEAKEINPFDGQAWRFRPTDQRRTLTLIFEYRIADTWVLNLRSYYGSGFAFVSDDPGLPRYPRDHYPEYKRIDVGARYSFTIHSVSSTVFVEVTNLFSHRNVLSFRGRPIDQFTPDSNLLLPLIANAGFRVKF